jgi:hypothetical protein
LVGAGTTTYFVLTPQDVEACVVHEMKGQVLSMQGKVENLCSRRFHEEMDISQSDFEMGEFKEDGSVVRLMFKSPKATLTEGQFLFSVKECEESKRFDFDILKTSRARDNEFIFTDKFEGRPLCVKTISMRGRYR